MEMLKEPITIRNVTLKNRLVMPPMATGRSDNGKVSREILAWYDEKTKGGNFGLVIIEHEYISLQGKASENQLSVSDDRDIEGLKQLSELVHANGSKTILQINHAGAKAAVSDPKAPSAGEYKGKGNTVTAAKEMSGRDIAQVIEDFVHAAKRAQLAGFDGVEVHAAHGYLLSQFYSPLTNRRTDEYNGSSLIGRTRLHTDILKAIRKETGEDFLVAIRFGCADDKAGGAEGKDAPEAAKLFEEAGADLIDVSGGLSGYLRPQITEPGYFKAEADAIARTVHVPVLTAGGITSAPEAEAILANTKIRLIGVARAVFHDSAWAARAMHE